MRILAPAEAEAEDAARRYDAQRLNLGRQFLDELARAFAVIERWPQAFPRMPTRKALREVRGYALHRFPYTVVYEVRPAELLILAIAHAGRRPNYWARRRG
jgi:hypothetical protein